MRGRRLRRMNDKSADFDHLEVFFADTAFGAYEVIWNVVPGSAGRDAFILVSFGFVIDPATNDTLPLSHLRALSSDVFQGAVRYLRHVENAMI